MSDVLYDVVDGIATLTLNRPEKKNALNPAMYEAMAEGLENAHVNDACRAVHIRANGNDFTAGNDISVFATGTEDAIQSTVRFMRALMTCKLPVVAEVKGNAVGIGTTMLLHCDFIYCSDNTKLLMPFINLGLVPEYASSYLIPKLAGHAKAAEWLLLGKGFGALEAKETGLATDVVNQNELQARCENVLKQLCAKPRQALIASKALIKQDHAHVTEHMHTELDIFAKAMQSPAAKEAFDAFLNKRPVDPAKFLQ